MSQAGLFLIKWVVYFYNHTGVLHACGLSKPSFLVYSHVFLSKMWKKEKSAKSKNIQKGVYKYPQILDRFTIWAISPSYFPHFLFPDRKHLRLPKRRFWSVSSMWSTSLLVEIHNKNISNCSCAALKRSNLNR